MRRRKILWLASWYPNKLDPFNGDFIKRQAEALSLYDDVTVFFLSRDPAARITKKILKEEHAGDNLKEVIVYYHNPSTKIPLLDKLISGWRYNKLYRRLLKEFIEEHGPPFIAHVHVGMKAGMIARWLKRRYHIPYVVTEHWSGFLKNADEKFQDKPRYFQSMWKKVVRDAAGICVVSRLLGSSVAEAFGISSCKIIHNVVDTRIFYPAAIAAPGCKLIHISGLAPLKNPLIILEAFSRVVQTIPDAHLDIYGGAGGEFTTTLKNLGLERNVRFHGEVSQQILAEALRDACGLVLYSAYETFGCVIIEANACGVPVIVSDIPVFHETVSERVNGFFAGNENVPLLAAKMIDLIQNKTSFDRYQISKIAAEKYGYEIIGKELTLWYDAVLSKQTGG